MTLSIAIFDKDGHAQACATRSAFNEASTVVANVMPPVFAYPEADLPSGALPQSAGPYRAGIVPNTWHVQTFSAHPDGSIRRFQMQQGGTGGATEGGSGKARPSLPSCPACGRVHLREFRLRAWWRRWA